ncbi:MAG: DinB family protein [Phycisphaerales bacterium]
MAQGTIGQYAQMTLPEFSYELSTTRKLLERIPEAKLDWKMDERSHTLAWNGAHLAEMPGWTANILHQPFFDMNPPGGEPYETPSLTSVAQILEMFDANVADAVKAIETFSDDAVMQDWEFRDAGNVMFTLPRAGAFRTWVLSHSIHHRAILSVYFRQLGVKVPSIYGPSSDEGM